MTNLIKANQINTGKVVLTKEQHKAIESAKERYGNERVVEKHCDGEFEWLGNHEPLMALSTNTLIIALYRPEDITIQQTVEEKLLEAYKKNEEKMDSREYSYYNGVTNGMVITLELIGMKVKGINE